MARQVTKREAQKLAETIPGGMPFELVDRTALDAAVQGRYLVLEASDALTKSVIGDVTNLRRGSSGRDRLKFDCKTPDGTAYRGIITDKYTIFTQLR